MQQYRMIDGADITGITASILAFYKKMLLFIFTAFRQYIIVAVLVFTLVFGAGFYYWHRSTPAYRAEMVCSFTSLSKKTYGEMVHQLDILAQSHSYDALSKELNIPLAQAQKIIRIEGRNMMGSLLYEDPTSGKDPLYLSVTTTDKTIFKSLEQALVIYLNTNSPFNNKRNEMERESLSKKQEYLINDLRSMDSVIAASTTLLKQRANDTSMKINNAVAFFAFKKSVEEEVVKNQWRLKELEQIVEVLHGFVVPDYPTQSNKKPLWMSAIVAFVVSLFSCTTLKIVRDSKKQPVV